MIKVIIYTISLILEHDKQNIVFNQSDNDLWSGECHDQTNEVNLRIP